MQELWRTLEYWLSRNVPSVLAGLRPGASDDEVVRLEATVGIALPDDLRESLLIHDGEDELNYAMGGLGVFPNLLPTAGIIEVWQDHMAFNNASSPAILLVDGPIKPMMWNPRWIPFIDDDGDSYLCVDLDPDVGGTYGQVIKVYPDERSGSCLAPSLRSLLERYISDIYAGDVVAVESGRLKRAHT